MITAADLHGKHLLNLADFTPDEITYLIDLAAELKAAKAENRLHTIKAVLVATLGG
jgi:ornithine carbamoyltransferase